MYFDSFNKIECSGCTACANSCPVSAIIMKEDIEGFLYPFINEQTCIHCDLCKKICSWEHPIYHNNDNPITLAAVLKDKPERQNSTSGGVFYAISKWIIEQGGVVYGAAFNKELQLIHISAETIDELQPIRGSKYIQSNLNNIFKDVKQQLETGRWCYFTGTGCQVAGLKAYLRKEYKNLITSDIVCHGVPSQKIFNEHIIYMENKYHDKVIDYKFRDYKKGEGCEICGFSKRRPVIKPSYELSPYLYGFMYGLINRYSCYECKYAKIPRQGDITLADYWGVGKFFPNFDNSNGCSLVLLNSKKGEDMWGRIKDKCDYKESNCNDAAIFNRNLIDASNKPLVRDVIYDTIEKEGYASVAKQYFRSPDYFKTSIICFIRNLFIMRPFKYVLKFFKKLR